MYDGTIVRSELEGLLSLHKSEIEKAVEANDLAGTVRQFAGFREEVLALKTYFSALEEEINNLSYNVIPTMMGNAHLKSAHIEGLGIVAISVRWSATMPDRDAGMAWVREHEPSLIIETVASPTLTAYAKERALAGDPLPDIFKVSTSPFTSIKGE